MVLSMDGAFDAYNAERLRAANTLLLGANSDTVTEDETGPWRDTTRVVRRADAHRRVAELRQEPGREILVFGSRTLWNDLLAYEVGRGTG